MEFPKLKYQVTSDSTGEVYHISISRFGENLTCTCTCEAGKKHMHCKHRMGILIGDHQGVTGDVGSLHLVDAMLAGTDVGKLLEELKRLEMEQDQLKKAIAKVKKDLGRALDN